MKLDDLIQADNTVELDEDISDALAAFGFIATTYSLYQKQPSGQYVGVLAGEKPDGTIVNWIGTGTTPDEAYANAIDACAKWILNQPIPFWPIAPAQGVTP